MRCNRLAGLVAFASLIGLCGCTPSPPAATVAPPPPIGLETETFGVAGEASGPLFLILSDQADVASRETERAAARSLIAAVPGSLAYLVLRPGHAGANGIMSPGDAGSGTGDELARAQIDVIAGALEAIERRHPSLPAILIGQGMAAAAVANIAGTHPQLARGMALAGCPCTLPEYRAARAVGDGARWKSPTAGLDPLQTAGGIRPSMRAVLVVGDADPIFRPRYSRTYAEGLALRGISTDLRIIPGARGNLFGTPEWTEAVTKLALAIKEKP